MKEILKNFLRSLVVALDKGRKQVDDQALEMAKSMGRVFAEQDYTEKLRHERCNHRKGGMVCLVGTARSISEGLYNGSAPQYAVRKHQMMNGDIWVDCIRCGKKWRPPVESNFLRRNWLGINVVDKSAFVAAWAEYKGATFFPTNNVMSSSIQCRFTDPKTGRDATDQIRSMYAALGE